MVIEGGFVCGDVWYFDGCQVVDGGGECDGLGYLLCFCFELLWWWKVFGFGCCYCGDY